MDLHDLQVASIRYACEVRAVALCSSFPERLLPSTQTAETWAVWKSAESNYRFLTSLEDPVYRGLQVMTSELSCGISIAKRSSASVALTHSEKIGVRDPTFHLVPHNVVPINVEVPRATLPRYQHPCSVAAVVLMGPSLATAGEDLLLDLACRKCVVLPYTAARTEDFGFGRLPHVGMQS